MRVLVFGTFDGLHPGHRFVLEQAMRRGEVHVVVARDRTVHRIKGRLPLHTEEQRAAAIRAAFPHAIVVLGDTEDYMEPVRTLQPDLILLGYDQALPPGVQRDSLPCPVERVHALEPAKYKSSLLRSTDDASASQPA